MRVIDLLNKIANGEKLPKIIKVMGGTYYLCEGDQSGSYYFSEKQGFGGVKLKFDTSVMNEEVEIIEEDKKIKKLPYYDYKEIMSENNRDNSIEKLLEKHDKRLNDYHEKINEIIDRLNKEGNNNE